MNGFGTLSEKGYGDFAACYKEDLIAGQYLKERWRRTGAVPCRSFLIKFARKVREATQFTAGVF